MASDRADRHQRRSVVSNSDLLARATRLFRALRLEHDPQPGLKRLRSRTAVVSSCRKLSGGHSADIRMSLKGVGRSAKAPERQAEWLLGGPLSVPFGEPGFQRPPDARTRQIQI